jgi:mono/diheme cytochrome c family protein
MPVLVPAEPKTKLNQPVSATATELADGAKLFNKYCNDCHTLNGGGTIPNLTYSKPEIIAMIDDIVRKGIFLTKGMPNFGNRFTPREVKNIQQYIYAEAKKK